MGRLLLCVPAASTHTRPPAFPLCCPSSRSVCAAMVCVHSLTLGSHVCYAQKREHAKEDERRSRARPLVCSLVFACCLPSAVQCLLLGARCVPLGAPATLPKASRGSCIAQVAAGFYKHSIHISLRYARLRINLNPGWLPHHQPRSRRAGRGRGSLTRCVCIRSPRTAEVRDRDSE